MDLPQRKRPPPLHFSISQTLPHPLSTIAKLLAAHIDPEPVNGLAVSRHLPNTLWRYGQAVDGLHYAVGRESSLPCSKDEVRHCLREAISLAQDVGRRAKLRDGYAWLEAFVTDREFEIVRQLESSLPRTHSSHVSPARMSQRMTSEGRADTPACAILTRIARQMRARRREIRGAF